MSLRLTVLFTLLMAGFLRAGLSADAGKDGFAPKIRPIEQYQALWKRSPFIVETKAEQVSVGLAGRYSLVGIASVAGKPIVFLVDKTNSDPVKNRLMVSKGAPGKDGIDLVSVSMDQNPRKSSAVVRQGGQQATLIFDPTSLAPQGANLSAGVVPPPPGMINRQGLPPAMIPPPSNITPAVPPAPTADAPAATPPPSARRIIRPAPINLSN